MTAGAANAASPLHSPYDEAEGMRLVAAEYVGLGFDPIRLRAGTNIPACTGYATLPVLLQWTDARGDDNIGLRAGNGIAFLDFDDKNMPGTSEAGLRWLGGLGYYPNDFPLVQTPSGGSHVYVMFRGNLPGHWRNLARGFGRGEFRYGPAALVAAPPSVREGRQYRLIGGDYRQLPRLEVVDVLPILQNKDTGEVDPAAAILATAPSGEPGRIGRGTWRLLRGEGLNRYPSRSEHEAAIVAGLCNTGLSFQEILGLFLNWPCGGKFSELHAKDPKEAVGWLRRTWEKERTWTTAHVSEGRKLAFQAVQWAQFRPWLGRAKGTDRAAYLTHALTAYHSGKVEYNLSERELAERAGIGQDTAHNANQRLQEAGLIARVKGQHNTCGVLWRLQSGVFPSIPHVPHSEELIGDCHFGHDAFRQRPRRRGTREVDGLQGGLSKTPEILLTWLRRQPMTAKELAVRTELDVSTIHKNLKRMSRILDPATGEVLRLVEPDDGDTWRAVDTDLDAVARAVGTAGIGERQRAKHAAERAEWRRTLDRQHESRPARVAEFAARNVENDGATMFDVKEDCRYRMPNGVPVTARRSDLPGLVWELRAPGGWATWDIDESGAILAVEPGLRKRPTLRPTGWCVADLTPDRVEVSAAAPADSASG